MAKKNVKVNATEEIVNTGIVKEEEVMANEVITNAEVTAVKEEEVMANETTTRVVSNNTNAKRILSNTIIVFFCHQP